MLEKPVVFDWEKFRSLDDSEKLLWRLALEQWFTGHEEIDDKRSFVEGFKSGWVACKAVEES